MVTLAHIKAPPLARRLAVSSPSRSALALMPSTMMSQHGMSLVTHET